MCGVWCVVWAVRVGGASDTSGEKWGQCNDASKRLFTDLGWGKVPAPMTWVDYDWVGSGDDDSDSDGDGGGDGDIEVLVTVIVVLSLSAIDRLSRVQYQ